MTYIIYSETQFEKGHFALLPFKLEREPKEIENV